MLKKIPNGIPCLIIIVALFGSCGYTWGVNTNPNGAMKDGQIRLNVGAKIHIDLLKGLKWEINKW